MAKTKLTITAKLVGREVPEIEMVCDQDQASVEKWLHHVFPEHGYVLAGADERSYTVFQAFMLTPMSVRDEDTPDDLLEFKIETIEE